MSLVLLPAPQGFFGRYWEREHTVRTWILIFSYNISCPMFHDSDPGDKCDSYVKQVCMDVSADRVLGFLLLPYLIIKI